MTRITDIASLEALYPKSPSEPALRKVARRLTPLYRRWIEASRFCVLSTVGRDGTDGSPRGDDGPVVLELDPSTLALPDWRGNNRLDSLRNIVTDGRVSLMFMVPGSTTVVRVNGHATLETAPELCGRFVQKGRQPKSVIVIAIAEIYTQCAKAILRSGLWMSHDESSRVPTAGQILAEMTNGEVDAAAYDEERRQRGPETLW